MTGDSAEYADATDRLEVGDVVEVRRRYKVIGFDGPDTLTLNLEDGTTQIWMNDRIIDRGDLNAVIINDDD